MVDLFANSGDPDRMPCSAASDLGLHCLPFTRLEVYRLQWARLILKMTRKPASENAVYFYCLLNILANFSNLFLHTGKQCGP